MIKEYVFGTYTSRGLKFSFNMNFLLEDGKVDTFLVTILYEDMQAFGDLLGYDQSADDWMTEESFYEEVHDAVMDEIPFLMYRFHDAVADGQGELWYYNTHNLRYHASDSGVTVKGE